MGDHTSCKRDFITTTSVTNRKQQQRNDQDRQVSEAAEISFELAASADDNKIMQKSWDHIAVFFTDCFDLGEAFD